MKKSSTIATSCLLVAVLFSLYFVKGYSTMNCTINSPADVAKLFPTTVNEIQRKQKEFEAIILNDTNTIITLHVQAKTFANTFGALDEMAKKTGVIANPISALENLSPLKEIRDAAHEAILSMTEFEVEYVSVNKQLYLALKEYVDGNMKKEQLTPEQEYFIDNTMDSFVRMGLDLDNNKLAQVRILLKELAKLSLDFEKNINQDQSSMLLSKQELAGVPEQIINSLEKSGDKYIIKTDYPTMFAIFDYAELEQTRKKAFNLFNKRAYPANMTVLEEVVKKRHELATLLGFKSFAHLDLDSEMAETPENAQAFIAPLIAKATIKAQQEIKDFLQDLNKPELLDATGKIQPWNIRYIKDRYKQKHLAIDNKLVAEYFPLEFTFKELLHIYEQFLSIQFKEIPADGFWHPEVKFIEVLDKQNNLIAYLLLDLFPRADKFSHAAHMSIIPAVKNNCPEVSIVMANFPKASGNMPALLTYDDVKTFFHEFGHAMHAVLGRTALASQSGTSVKRDFVEMPSQMLEGWMKDPEILTKISKHYITGKPLPKDLIKKLTRLEQFDAGTAILRQLVFAQMSLELFDENPDKNIHTTAENIFKRTINYIAWQPDDFSEASFGHLMGYGAKYYGYMWSKVFACDLFEQIAKIGLLSPIAGKKYIDLIIGRGGSKDPNQMLEEFLGRKPSQEAFLREMGLK